MRQQLIDFTRALRRQAREDILQIRVRIMTIQPRRLDQTHDHRRPFTAEQRPCKEPVLAPKSPWSDLVLRPIIINGYGPVIEVARQRCPTFETVIECSADSRTFGHKITLGDPLGMQSIHHRHSFFLPYSAP
ncbi:hypothetical protein ALQ47_101005 [Pseudomonas cichorii]|nr:hypothetical protein ALQ47_101005 [Pseudomonas cichorii]